MAPGRVRRIEPTDPGGEPVCQLSAEGARRRRVPVDRLLTPHTWDANASRNRLQDTAAARPGVAASRCSQPFRMEHQRVGSRLCVYGDRHIRGDGLLKSMATPHWPVHGVIIDFRTEPA